MKIAIVDSGKGLLTLLEDLISNNIKHEYHLFFTSCCPIGNLSTDELYEEVIRLKKNLVGFDRICICCNTLSPYFMNDKRCIRILDYNLKYLKEHDVLPIGTRNTINYLKKGYSEIHLAKDIENNDWNKVEKDIKRWPDSKTYLLCCTHYILALPYIQKIKPNTKVIDLTYELYKEICILPQEKRLSIISHKI